MKPWIAGWAVLVSGCLGLGIWQHKHLGTLWREYSSLTQHFENGPSYPRPQRSPGYVPYKSVHQVGNFRYDITQGNDCPDAYDTANHQDWVGFSATREPNFVECGFNEGVGVRANAA